MGRIGRLIKTEIEKFILQTVETHFGQNQLCDQYGPSGEDAPPLAEDRILLVKVEGTGNYVSCGVLTVSQGAKAGEKIIYSRDSDGNIQAIIKLLNDGKIQINSPGDTEIKSDKNINIEGVQNTIKGNSKVTGGTFECGGTVAPTGSGALCGVPYCLFTGAPHCGSISSGT